jgi:hypothetical protein
MNLQKIMMVAILSLVVSSQSIAQDFYVAYKWVDKIETEGRTNIDTIDSSHIITVDYDPLTVTGMTILIDELKNIRQTDDLIIFSLIPLRKDLLPESKTRKPTTIITI